MTKKQKLAIVKRTRELVARRGGWLQGGYWSRTNFTVSLFGKSPLRNVHLDADDFSFCLAGAAKRAHLEITGDEKADEVEIVKQLSIDALAAAKLAAAGGRVVESDIATFAFNDRSRTRKRDVIALLDEKIAELEA